jgi:ATP-dependent Lhr-like helicase
MELLDPEVVAETEAELQRLAPDRACRDAEALADLLREIGPLSAAEVAARSTDPPAAPGWLAELAAQRRAIEVRVAGEERWAAAEDAGRLRDALGSPLPPGIPFAFTEPVADPLGDLVSRYARSHGPFTAHAVADRYGLGVAVVTGALHRLAGSGRVTEGEFLAGGRGTEWCDTGVLRLLRRRCLARLRKEAEPVPPQALAAFLPAWQDAGHQAPAPGRPAVRAARRASADAVYDVIEQLAGATLPASALETLVLPGRVPGYQPAMLDELTAAGEVVWTGAGGLPGGDGWLAIGPASATELLFAPPGEITMTPLHEAVLAVLDGGGALFFRTLAERAAAVLAAGKDAYRGAWPRLAAPAGRRTPGGRAIWDLVWAGLLTNDTLAPLRRAGQRAPVGAPGPGRRACGLPALRAGLRGRGEPVRLGRMALPSTGRPGDRAVVALPAAIDPQTRRLHALARVAAERHGILIRRCGAAERVPAGSARSTRCCGLWRTRASAAGVLRRLGAAQFRAARGRSTGCGRWRAAGTAAAAAVLAAADPANAYGRRCRAGPAGRDAGQPPSGPEAGAGRAVRRGLVLRGAGREDCCPGPASGWSRPRRRWPTRCTRGARAPTVERADGGGDDSPLAQALEKPGSGRRPAGCGCCGNLPGSGPGPGRAGHVHGRMITRCLAVPAASAGPPPAPERPKWPAGPRPRTIPCRRLAGQGPSR